MIKYFSETAVKQIVKNQSGSQTVYFNGNLPPQTFDGGTKIVIENNGSGTTIKRESFTFKQTESGQQNVAKLMATSGD